MRSSALYLNQLFLTTANFNNRNPAVADYYQRLLKHQLTCRALEIIVKGVK